MSTATTMRTRLRACPAGKESWREFEDACIESLKYLFVPPLNEPVSQARSYSGIDRRDAVFPNRNFETTNNWGRLYLELGARMVLFEFKNYKETEIGKEETNQTRNYLTKPMGRLAILCCNKQPNDAAHKKRNSIYSEDGKVILFITVDDLEEMLYIKERGDDPCDFILDLVEKFYIQHE